MRDAADVLLVEVNKAKRKISSAVYAVPKGMDWDGRRRETDRWTIAAPTEPCSPATRSPRSPVWAWRPRAGEPTGSVGQPAQHSETLILTTDGSLIARSRVIRPWSPGPGTRHGSGEGEPEAR